MPTTSSSTPSAQDAPSRPYDLLVYGATHPVGRAVAAQAVAKAHALGLRVALAGPRVAPLRTLARDLARDDQRPEVVTTSLDRPATLKRAAAQARAVLAADGPITRAGLPVARACVEEGTDYLDLSGAPAALGTLTDALDDAARERNVAVIPCCGLDSAPLELAAALALRQLPRDAPTSLACTVRAHAPRDPALWRALLDRLHDPSFHPSALLALARPPSDDAPPAALRALKPPPLAPHPHGESWRMPLPTAAVPLIHRARAARSGQTPPFRYRQHLQRDTPRDAITPLVAAAALAAAVRIPGLAALLRHIAPSPRPDAPTPNAQLTWHARTPSRRLVVQLHIPKLDLDTHALVGVEAACALLHLRQHTADPDAGPRGVLTPSLALGDALTRALTARGLRFLTLSDQATPTPDANDA